MYNVGLCGIFFLMHCIYVCMMVIINHLITYAWLLYFGYISGVDSRVEMKIAEHGDDVKKHQFQPEVSTQKVHTQSSSICNKILVSGFSTSTDDDLIHLFFGSKRRTGGGPVSSVNRIGKTCATVEFESSEGVW